MTKTQNDNPVVSVVMPVYNGETFIGEAIESILSQTYQNYELLIVNDSSTDSTGKIIEYYQKLYPQKIKTFNIREKGGAFAAINSVLKKCEGKFIALMDSDDISLPDRLRNQVRLLENNPEVIVTGTQAIVINKNGKEIGKKKAPQEDQQIKTEFAFSHPMIHPSCIIRKSLLPNKECIYENKYGVNDDYYTFFKLLNFGKFANTDEVLYEYRIHSDNSSLKNLKRTLFNTIRIRLDARKSFHYQLPVSAFLSMLALQITLNLIPEKFILNFYLLIRGIYSPKEILTNTLFLIKTVFLRPVYFCQALIFRQE